MKKVLIRGRLFFNRILSFLFPPLCICCDEYTTNKSEICTNCYSLLLNTINNDIVKGSYLDTQISFFEFSNHSRAIIHGLKYYNRPRAAQSIVRSAIRNSTMLQKTSFNVIVPVPLHWYKQLRRGYNQAEIIANVVAEEFSTPSINALQRVAYGRSQTKKNHRARRKGIQNAFSIKDRYRNQIKGVSVLLIDDVLTTGATSDICAALLYEMGAESVSLMTIASVSID